MNAEAEGVLSLPARSDPSGTGGHHPEGIPERYLMPTLPGRALVALYYSISPPLADFIEHHPGLRFSTRLLLYPVVSVSRLMLDCPRGTKFAILIILMGLSGVFIRVIMKPGQGPIENL